MKIQAKHPGTTMHFPGGAVIVVDHEKPTEVPEGMEAKVEDAVRFTPEVEIVEDSPPPAPKHEVDFLDREGS